MAAKLIPADPQLFAAVQTAIEQVRTAHTKALAQVEGKWLGGDEAKNAAAALRALQGKIDDWGARGLKAGAAQAGTKDADIGPKGWMGWMDAGEVFLHGIQEIQDIGLEGRLQNWRRLAEDMRKSLSPAGLTKGVVNLTKAAAKSIAEGLDEVSVGWTEVVAAAAVGAVVVYLVNRMMDRVWR